ncbi:metalloregulator ArsR/SmtB family transcription factor [Bacillus sp. 03113]|uniref:helix-turn-helix transcriptional regulator n=1 Tax=Bacillus sp. 03113 TaxID=2578211 RepID=UPI001141BC25|nr:helix-turn-helix domain-containing protein [Bacillus sp. 03113]
MEQTLKVTSVLSDPTRYYIYQYITNRHQDVTVQEIADQFEIHPNVARLHLTKLEDVNMLISETKKTGKGGRPSRLYRLSDDVIQLNFPYRDYELLSKITFSTLTQLGEPGKKALNEVGRQFGKEMIEKEKVRYAQTLEELPFYHRLSIFKAAATSGGLHPEIEVDENQSKIFIEFFNCPFKEVAINHKDDACNMHFEYLKGMIDSLFDGVELIEKDNMLNGCHSCTYQALVAK